MDAAAYRFGLKFAQKSKEQVEQMRAIQAVLSLQIHFWSCSLSSWESRGGGGLKPGAEWSIQALPIQGNSRTSKKGCSYKQQGWCIETKPSENVTLEWIIYYRYYRGFIRQLNHAHWCGFNEYDLKAMK